mgnify:CR=1 FL=1
MARFDRKEWHYQTEIHSSERDVVKGYADSDYRITHLPARSEPSRLIIFSSVSF